MRLSLLSLGARAALISLVAMGAKSVGAAQEGVSVDSFAPLAQDDRVRAVLAGLEGRQADFDVCQYQLEETVSSYPPQGDSKVLRRSVYEMRRSGAKVKYHIKRLDAAGKLQEEFDSNWDGRTAKGLQQTSDGLMGSIRDRRVDYIFMIYYNHMLGWDRPDEEQVVDWLKKAVARKVLRVEPVEQDGRRVLELKVTTPLRVEQYWVDPERGFMLTGHHYRYEKGSSFNEFTTKVTKCSLFDGLWVPTEVRKRSATSATPEQSENVFVLKDFNRKPTDPKELEITFPTGTHVLDYSSNKLYLTEEGGSKKPLPLYDTNIGKITIDGRPMDEANAPLATASVVDHTGRTTAIIASGLLPVIILGGIWYVRKMRRRGETGDR